MKKILVVEDNLDIRENLAEILELSGYQVNVAENGKIGVEMAFKEVPDLILCDIMMPELDGFGVLHILSKNALTYGIPFIFLTAKSEKDDFRKGMSLGADDYITKPFDDVHLLETIERRLLKSEKLRHKPGTTKSVETFLDTVRGFETLKKLAEDREVRMFKKRDLVYEEGKTPRYLYVLKSGKVKIYRTNEDGKEFILNIATEGDFIGYTDLLKGGNHAESAAILQDAELILIPKDDFLNLIYQDNEVAARMIKMIAANISEREQQLIDLAYNSVRKRVAAALMNVFERYEKTGQYKIDLLREDLANLAGTAKETLIRTLSEYKSEKLIDIQDNLIIVLEPEKLKHMRN
ncbi:MAG: response regulator [Saprospiraceae bacterium]